MAAQHSPREATAIGHTRYEVNSFGDACRECGEEWPCRTVLIRALRMACDDAYTDGDAAFGSYVDAAAAFEDGRGGDDG